MKSKIRKIMNKKLLAFVILMLIMPVMMGAQALKGSYFLDNSLNRNKLNPALAPEKGYVQIPAIGNLSAGLTGNLNMSTLLYPMDGQLVTFLHKGVTMEQFDAALASNPYLDLAVDLNLINFGWRRNRSFWTVDMGVRVNADVDVSRDLFMFLKKGTGTSGTYNLGPVNANVGASLQAAVGYSRDLSDVVPGLSVGGKVRAILPAAYAGVDLDEVTLDASTDKWTVNADGAMNVAFKGGGFIDPEGQFAAEFDGPFGLAGFGMSVDLGAEYKLKFDNFINGLNFSAAVTDLGFISYNADVTKNYVAGGSMDWTGMVLSLEDGNTGDAMTELGEQFEKLIAIRNGENASVSRSSLPSFYVGVEMPFCNNKMSLGALYSARTSYVHTRSELTVSYNLNPTRWFAFGLNYSFLNTVKTLGWMLEFTPKAGPCFFIGSDYTFLELAPSPEDFIISAIPTSTCLNVRFGLAIAL